MPFICIGGTEIANLARVTTYGSGEFFDDCPCPALDRDTFVGVAEDPAPWYDSAFPNSEDFLGFLPESITSAVCQFPDLASATRAVIIAMQMSIPVARIELLDDVQMDACIRYSKLEGFEVKPTLFFEFHGTTASTREQAELMQQITAEYGGSAFHWAVAAEERSKMWKARHNAYYAVLALKPGCQAFATDACVPISRLADCLLETRADVDREGMIAPIVGHVGDGNFHLVLLFDPNDPVERGKAEAIAQRVSERAISMGGTCTGEHGIGIHKLDALVTEHGDAAVELMRRIKRALDPLDIMNPGKTVPMQPKARWA